jgi:regulator of protease activity HflC (stomatin/prohibitin superfamily)
MPQAARSSGSPSVVASHRRSAIARALASGLIAQRFFIVLYGPVERDLESSVHGNFAGGILNPVTLFLVVVCLGVGAAITMWVTPSLGLPFIALAILIALSLKMANTWEKFVILRMGKLQSVKGAGLFAIIPVIDNVVAVIDERIQTTAFNAEQALTRDTVPVNVDAIIFWHVHDAEKAALAITNYREAIDRVAQTSLREMIGASMLASLLSDRKEADQQLKEGIGRKTAPWGISVSSVEIRDVAIPVALQDAMSRQAQAEREKQARVILGSAEAAIAGKFVEAADIYAGHPAALQLRAMNIIYETTKERGTTILIPSAMVDSLNPSAASPAPAEGSNASSDTEAARGKAAARPD